MSSIIPVLWITVPLELQPSANRARYWISAPMYIPISLDSAKCNIGQPHLFTAPSLSVDT